MQSSQPSFPIIHRFILRYRGYRAQIRPPHFCWIHTHQHHNFPAKYAHGGQSRTVLAFCALANPSHYLSRNDYEVCPLLLLQYV
jgi:hypothetical protein